jgi:hypothetical protein
MNYELCIAEKCDCIYDDDNNVNFLCTNCKKYNDKEKANPWYIEIIIIRKYLQDCDIIEDLNLRIITIKKLFEFLLTRPDFIAKNPNFRKCLLSKIDQFKNDEQGKDLHSLCDNLNNFIKCLEDKDNYIK